MKNAKRFRNMLGVGSFEDRELFKEVLTSTRYNESTWMLHFNDDSYYIVDMESNHSICLESRKELLDFFYSDDTASIRPHYQLSGLHCEADRFSYGLNHANKKDLMELFEDKIANSESEDSTWFFAFHDDSSILVDNNSHSTLAFHDVASFVDYYLTKPEDEKFPGFTKIAGRIFSCK